MGGFLPTFPGMDVTNDTHEIKKLNIMHRHVEERADGTKITVERSLEHEDNVYCKGSDWLVNKNPNWDGQQDRPQDHFRDNKKFTLARETTIIEDKNGNRTIDEKAVRKEDIWSTHGTKLIGDRPERNRDSRNLLLEEFTVGGNPFQILGSGTGFTPLLGEGKQNG
jgi:hypothetical protein